jgi:uncharacterized integral membrane protein (TIGR00698 family)
LSSHILHVGDFLRIFEKIYAKRTLKPSFAYADLYNDVGPDPQTTIQDYLPGLAVTACATLAAGYLSDHYHAPLTLMALLVGLALNFLSADKKLLPGLAFASRTLLRVGIVLVGARVTFGQIVDLGPVAFGAILIIVIATIAIGVVAAHLWGYDTAFGVLAGGSVAICGASAALALATVLGEKRISQAQLTLVLVGISAASSFALFFYPILAHQLHLSDAHAGFMLGASIHDVAQAIGAGYVFSEGAGQIATIVKLTRVALLAPVMASVAFMFRQEKKNAPKVMFLPWFVIGFFVLGMINSTLHIPSQISIFAHNAATILLACSVTATGIRAPMASLRSGGPRPLMVIAAASALSLLLAALTASLILC